MTLCLNFLGMSQVTTQVSETKILDALVTGHTASELPEMVQYTHICTVTVKALLQTKAISIKFKNHKPLWFGKQFRKQKRGSKKKKIQKFKNKKILKGACGKPKCTAVCICS